MTLLTGGPSLTGDPIKRSRLYLLFHKDGRNAVNNIAVSSPSYMFRAGATGTIGLVKPDHRNLDLLCKISRKNGQHYQIGQGQPEHCKPSGTATDVSK